MTDIIEILPTETSTDDATIDKPYDAFVRLMVEYPEVAKELVSQYIDPSLTKLMDFHSIQLDQGKFVPPDYSRKETDVLFKIKCDAEWAYLYVLIEHQHEPDSMMPFRLLQYMTQIMQREKKRRKDGKLPLVIPLILYDGNKPWKHSTDFRDLIAGPKEIIEQVWNKPFRLIQASDVSDDEIKQYNWSGTMAWMMAHAQTRDVLEQLKKSIVSPVLEEFDARGGRERQFVVELFRHLLYTGDIEEAQIQQYVHEHFTADVEGKIMTLAQRLEERGIQQGMQQGMLKGKMEGIQEGELKGIRRQAAETAMKLLRRGGYDLKEIAEISGLPLHEVELLTVE